LVVGTPAVPGQRHEGDVPGARAGEGMGNAMKLCMMSYTMARQGVGVEEIVRCAEELGLEGIDWVSTYGRDARELRALSDAAGLTVACHTFFLRSFPEGDGWLDEAKQGIDDAVALGAPVVMIPTGTRPEMDRSEFRRRWIDALAEIMPFAREAGVILTVENFPGAASAFVTAVDFYEAQRQVPGLKLTFDNGNAASGEDPVASFRQCAADVVHIHLKDWTVRSTPAEGYRQMLDGRYYRPALIGEGDMPTAECWQAFREAGYGGYINIEYEGNEIPAAEAMRRAVSYLRSL
jgi:sugar phosphate isomerase/epimerase